MNDGKYSAFLAESRMYHGVLGGQVPQGAAQGEVRAQFADAVGEVLAEAVTDVAGKVRWTRAVDPALALWVQLPRAGVLFPFIVCRLLGYIVCRLAIPLANARSSHHTM